jgi:hypothetical protein
MEAKLSLGESEDVTIRFDANQITPYWIDTAQKRLDANDNLSLPVALSQVIIGWDVVDAEPTAETLSKLSFPVMGELFKMIMEAAVPGAAEGNESSRPLDVPLPDSEPDSSTFPNGSTTSRLPASSESRSPI